MSMVSFKLNNDLVNIEIDPLKRLIDVLREDLAITSAKEGCGQGECGACSILIDNKLVNSCLVPVGSIEGKNILTIEGLKGTREFNILQESFEESGAVQCGFCIPGMIMASYALLIENGSPREAEIREGLSGNLCRCTGYEKIILAVTIASKRGEKLWKHIDQ
jgi:carbon-monoxide dehydrogenase small subunit